MRSYKINISRKVDFKVIIFDDKEKYKKTHTKLNGKEYETETYGTTFGHDKKIIINYVLIKQDKQELGQVIMHELGHAYAFQSPSHIKYDDANDVYADAFEVSWLFKDEAEDIANKYLKYKGDKND